MSMTVDGRTVVARDNQSIRCILEMTEDCAIWVIVNHGCSVPDVHDMLRQLTLCGGHFEHVTIVADEGDVA
jgi:hypothetical protein